ncbi:MAG: hypothetical protein LCH39_00210 [Proteobacteria bacterium]|nr:hypothetical protein [Pseudomonadota bacterium]
MPAKPLASPASARATPKEVVVVINRRAGRVLQMGQESFARTLSEGFARHNGVLHLVFAQGEDINAALKAVDPQTVGLLVLAGGDGTLSHALDALVASPVPCAILPLGTLNLLGRDLGLTGDLAHDIDAICTGTPRAVSLAEVNGRRFHSNAGFGLMSTMARERENARRAFPFSRALGFVAAGLRTLFTYRPIEVELGEGEKRRQFYADTVLVTSNHFEGMPWRRPNLEGRLLEVHLLEAGGLSARLKLLWLAAQGRWRDHDRLTSFTATRFIVRRRKKRSVALSIDGEACRLHGPIVFNVAPETLYLHAPDT